MGGSVVRFVDAATSGLWSLVVLENGDPIWISIAQSGVLVKRSKLGMFGARLFEASALDAAKVAMQLDAAVEKYETPLGMSNIALKAFTQTAMNCATSAEVVMKLNQELQRAK